MPETDVHPYFTGKARALFERAGGDPANAGRLAEWAEAAHAGRDSRRRVVVAADGVILGEGKYFPGRVSAAYVVSVVDDRFKHLLRRELGLALGGFAREYGMPVIVATFSEVCTGPAVRR